MNRYLLALYEAAWPGFLGALALVALLSSFHQVVLGAVRQGELRRGLVELHHAAGWRCNALRDRLGRESCLTQSNAVSSDAAALRALDGVPFIALQRPSH
jgi:hypothetical protein